MNFCQRSDKWFLVKCDNSNSTDLSEVTSAAGYCKATSPGPCISDYGQEIKCLDVISVLAMSLSLKAIYKYMA